jgi:hypothetical protein
MKHMGVGGRGVRSHIGQHRYRKDELLWCALLGTQFSLTQYEGRVFSVCVFEGLRIIAPYGRASHFRCVGRGRGGGGR